MKTLALMINLTIFLVFVSFIGYLGYTVIHGATHTEPSLDEQIQSFTTHN